MRIPAFKKSSGDAERRLSALENWAATIPTKAEDERFRAVSSTQAGGSTASDTVGAGTGGGGTGSGTIPESQVIFDPIDGHFHDDVESNAINLTGDVSGTNTTNTVDKVKGIDAPTPAAADDWKVLSYLHSSTDYVLRHPPFKNVTKTADYTATLDDFVIFADATAAVVTITLPTAASATQRGFYIKKIDAANNVVIDGNGAETIDGAATVTLTVQYESRLVVSTGTQWFVL